MAATKIYIKVSSVFQITDALVEGEKHPLTN